MLPHYPQPWQDEIRKKIPDFKDTVLIRAQSVQDELKFTDSTEGDATIYLSTRNLDLDGDVTPPTGWDLDIYRGQGLWSHRNDLPPVYKALSTETDTYGLKQVIKFADTEAAQDAKRLLKGGFLKTFSAGFKATRSLWRNDNADADEFDKCMADFEKNWDEFRGNSEKVNRVILEKILFESSICNIPANPFALVQSIHKKELVISEWMRKELKVEEYIKKAMDTGNLDRKVSLTAPAVPPSDGSGKAPEAPPAATKQAAPAPEAPETPAPPADLKHPDLKHPDKPADSGIRSYRAVPEIREFKAVREYRVDPIPELVAEAVKKTLAKIRGAV